MLLYFSSSGPSPTTVFLKLPSSFKKAPIFAEFFSTIGLFLIIYPVFNYDSSISFPGLNASLPCFGTALFILSNHRSQNTKILTLSGSILTLRPIVFIGLISYSWYLWHWPFIAFNNYLGFEQSFLHQKLFLLFLGLICALLSWRLIELPVRNQIFLKSWKKIFGFSIISLSLILSIGVICFYYDGFPKRFSDISISAIKSESDKTHIYEVSIKDVKNGKLPIIGSINNQSKPDFIVWGDSHAQAVLPALDKILLEKNLSGRAAVHSATAPVLGWFQTNAHGHSEDSLEFNEAVLEYITTNKISQVLLHCLWGSYKSTGGNLFEDAIIETVMRLRQIDVNVYMMLNVPVHSMNVPRTIARRGFNFMQANCTEPHEMDSFDGLEKSTLFDLTKMGVKIINPKPEFLNSSIKPIRYRVISTNGIILYRDSNHLSATGSIEILKPFFSNKILFDN